MKQVVKKWP